MFTQKNDTVIHNVFVASLLQDFCVTVVVVLFFSFSFHTTVNSVMLYV